MRAPWRWSRSCSRRRWMAATTALASMSSITSIAISVMQSQVLHFMILIVDGVRNFMARAMVYLRCVKGNIFVDPKITLHCCNFSVEKTPRLPLSGSSCLRCKPHDLANSLVLLIRYGLSLLRMDCFVQIHSSLPEGSYVSRTGTRKILG
ncbi:uncharacterized protein LOC125509500 [Triticum urartu]|uniref:uncharacterized protein LOC125509500 n=1 Tax=Triticum urartu TaxID=4572 RepID=UPI002044AB2B|nr:uncharacterized protein LOC125509500 [Triticum urartu]